MAVTVSEVWCSKCAEPSTAERDGVAYCERHDPAPPRKIAPTAITDPWLRAQWEQAANSKGGR